MRKQFIESRQECPEDFHCELCGAEDLVPSRIMLELNYGSRYDGDRLTLEICGNCADRLYKALQDIGKEVK